MPYLGMNVPFPSGICPLCVFSIKLCPIFLGAKIIINWDNLPGSTVSIKPKGTYVRAKCMKAWRCPFYFAHCVSSLYNCAPLGAKKKRFPGTISRFRRRYKGPNYEGLNVPLRYKCAPLPTLCLLYVTVPRNGQKSRILGKYVLTKKGHVLLLKQNMPLFVEEN